jgi:hypothetical protein
MAKKNATTPAAKKTTAKKKVATKRTPKETPAKKATKKAAKKVASKPLKRAAKPVKKAAKKAVKKRAAKKVAAKKVAKKVAEKSQGGRPFGSGRVAATADHAPTMRSLAARLSRDLGSIQTWSKQVGNPGRDDTKQFHVPSWLKWITAEGKDFKDTTEDGKNARARSAEADARLKEEKLKRMLGDSANFNEVIEVVGAILGDIKQECLTFGQRNSERLSGQDQGKIENILNARMRELLENVAIPDQKKNEGDSREFWK